MRFLHAEACLDRIKDLVSQGAVLVHHTQSLGVHLFCQSAILQGLGVDEHIQGSGLQGSLAADGAAAGVGDSQTGALSAKTLM